jgi:DNA-binding Lrp family transcriptional regulator
LTTFQKKLCNILQEGLPICWRPFAEIATTLGNNEADILRQTSRLKEMGVVRRICALINYRALGTTSTLVAAHVPQQSLKEVAEAVNSLANVSHNYKRNHYYNLWFTLRATTEAQIENTLKNLSGLFGIDFHSLKVVHTFKLDVRFDAESEGRELLQGLGKHESRFSCFEARYEPRHPLTRLDVFRPRQDQKTVIWRLQDDLKVTAEPFDFLCGQDLQKEDVLAIITELIDECVIRRIAAVVDHRKLGFVANVLFAGEVSQDRIVQVGQRLAHLPTVSHCYERQIFEGWPYNLFAMMHGQNMGQIEHVISKFTEAESIDSFELLPTEAELKKQPAKHVFD